MFCLEILPPFNICTRNSKILKKLFTELSHSAQSYREITNSMDKDSGESRDREPDQQIIKDLKREMADACNRLHLLPSIHNMARGSSSNSTFNIHFAINMHVVITDDNFGSSNTEPSIVTAQIYIPQSSTHTPETGSTATHLNDPESSDLGLQSLNISDCKKPGEEQDEEGREAKEQKTR